MSRSTRSTPPGWRNSPSAPMSRKAPWRGRCCPPRSRKPIPKHVISSRCSTESRCLRTRDAEPGARPRRRDDRPGRALSLGEGQAQRPRGRRPRPHDRDAQPSGRYQAARPALTSRPRAVSPDRPAVGGTLGADAGHPRAVAMDADHLQLRGTGRCRSCRRLPGRAVICCSHCTVRRETLPARPLIRAARRGTPSAGPALVSLRIEYDARAIGQAAAFLGDPRGDNLRYG